MIQGSGEYTLEAWVAPANVTQTNAYIVSYSGSNTTRNATLGAGRHAVPGLRAQQRHRHQRHAAAHHHHGRRRRAGGPAARGADLRPGQRPEDLRQRCLHRRRRSLQGRLARQLGQHVRAGARQRDHRAAAVAGRRSSSSPSTTAPSPRRRSSRTSPPASARSTSCCSASARSRACRSPTSSSRRAQYDNYSYLFYQPKFISLDPTATMPPNLQISGIRLGVNGAAGAGGAVVHHGERDRRRLELHRRATASCCRTLARWCR